MRRKRFLVSACTVLGIVLLALLAWFFSRPPAVSLLPQANEPRAASAPVEAEFAEQIEAG